MHEKFRKESSDGVVSGKGWKTRHKDNKIYSTFLPSPPPHILYFMLIPIRDPALYLPSFSTFWSNEAIVERWTDRAFQLVAFMRLVILSKVSPPISLGTIREFAIPGVGGACAHRKREVWCRYLRILARISSRYDVRLHSFHPWNGELERTKFVESLITLKEGGNYCCERRGQEILFSSINIQNDRVFKI